MVVEVQVPVGDDNSSTGPEVQSPFEMPDEDLDSEEAREFGENLCQITAKDWAEAQSKDETATLVMEYIKAGISSTDVTDDEMPDNVEASEVKRLIMQGELMELPNSSKMLVRRPTCIPTDTPDRNPGRYERLLGEEPVRTYVPLLLGPWVMDCTHKEAVHLGWQLARMVMLAEDAESKALPHTIKMLDLGKQYNVHLLEERLATVGEAGTWCWHVHTTAQSDKKFLHAL